MNNFKYALSLVSTLFGIKSNDEDTLIEIGLIAFGKIGNKRTRLYKAVLPVHHGVVNLPCNCDILEAVTVNGEDYNISDNIHLFEDTFSGITENYIESRKKETDQTYIPGRFIHYRQEKQCLYVNPCFSHVNILFYGELLDEEGLPEITDQEAQAIATYIAYTCKWKEYMQNKTKEAGQICQDLKKDWLDQCTQARQPEYVNQNDMDEILDALSRMPNKLYHKSFKPTL